MMKTIHGHDIKNGKTKAVRVFLAAGLVLFTLTTCRPMLLQDIAAYVPAYSQVVGPEGGTVTDSRGASVEIPEGALAEATTITIATYENPSGIYSRHGVTPFTGGADFGPDGTTFLKPVTITLPSAKKLIPGQEQSLFVFNPASGAWKQTAYTLTADSGGYSASAEVTHFTPYVASFLPPGSLSMFESYFDGTNGEVALGSYMAWFLTVTNLYGYTTECGNSTYEVVGIHFSVNYQVDGVPGAAASIYGEADGGATSQLNYAYDYTNSAGKEINYDLLVTVHFEVTENPEPAEADIAILEPLPGKTVSGIETIHTYIITGDDDADVTTVSFYADGALLGTDTEAPFLWYWDTDAAADGEHVLTATAELSTGKTVTSEGVTVRKGDSQTETVAAPEFDPPDGVVVPWTEIAISTATSGANIYYTTDGTTPACGVGTLYTEPITLSDDAIVKAIACKEGLTSSTITSGSYTVRIPRIVFASNRTGKDQIYVINVDGSNLTNLTSGASNHNPSPSPDGNKIVFTSFRDSTTEIYIMNSDGSNQTRLTNNSVGESYPQFSPDGTKILYAVGSNSAELWSMGVDGSNPTKVGKDGVSYGHFSISPDGTKIAIQSNHTEPFGYYHIYIMNIDGSDEINLTESIYNDGTPTFSPDGQKIVFRRYGLSFEEGYDELFCINSDGSGLARLTYNGPTGSIEPSYSTDGKKIIMAHGNSRISMIDSDGSNLQDITEYSPSYLDRYPSFIPWGD